MNYRNLDIKSGGMFLKIEAGKPKRIRILDEPKIVMRHSVQQNGQFKTFNCDGENCIYCQSGDHSPAKQKFIVNVYSHDDQKVMLYEHGSAVAKQIKKIDEGLSEDEQEIGNVDLRVESEGSGISTRYSVTMCVKSNPVPEGLQLLPKEKKGDVPF